MTKYFVFTKGEYPSVLIEKTYGENEYITFNSTEELDTFLSNKSEFTKVIRN